MTLEKKIGKQKFYYESSNGPLKEMVMTHVHQVFGNNLVISNKTKQHCP